MSPYTNELTHALLTVHRATLLTTPIFHHNSKGTLSKSDSSPVTIGDFGAQALIISSLRHAFPNDSIIAEEEASSLRENRGLAEEIWGWVKSARLDDKEAERELGGRVGGDDASDDQGMQRMLDIIDEGKKGDSAASGRTWALDPIDGTKGFLRGGQYAVALALIEDGDVKVGVLGCPNLPVDPADAEGGAAGKGVIFSAVKGQGAEVRSLAEGTKGPGKKMAMRQLSGLEDAVFCESVESGHSSHSDQARIAEELGIKKPSVRMDSQAKYGSVARGDGDIYLRLPVKKDYEEKIWDHAAGDIIVREAGGEVTDAEGKGLDFSKGRTLKANTGVVAAPKEIHGRVLEVVKAVLAGNGKSEL